jgi:hypothetical protein
MIKKCIKGLFDGLMCILSISYLIKFKEIFKIYFSIIGFNLFSLFYYLILLELIKYLNIYPFQLKWLVYLGWRIPMYIITFIYNIYYTNLLFSGFTRSSQYKWNYLVVVSIYNNSILIVLNCIPYFLPKNIVFKYLGILYNSLVNSFYCHRIYWDYQRIPFRQQLYLFEGNLFYHLGYGLWFSIFNIYFDFFSSHHINSLLYPLLILNTIILNSQIQFIKKPKYLYIFKFPMYFTNKLLFFFVYFIKTNSK